MNNDGLNQPRDILDYYNTELTFIRHMGAEFGARYPQVAAALQLETDRSQDPHVERLLQGFALLTARIQKKLDDQFPELTEGFFNVLYPHYLRPVPSMSVIEFELDANQGRITSGLRLPAGTKVFSQSVDNRACEFRTGYPVTLWPMEVASASIGRPAGLGPEASGAAASIRLTIRFRGSVKLDELNFDSLRFFLNGEEKLTFPLYELIFNHAERVVVRSLPNGRPIVLPGQPIRPVGFERHEGLIPFDERSFQGYRLLQEYFAFPWKFLFFDLQGLGAIPRLKDEDQLQVDILLGHFEGGERLSELERGTSAETFRLGCTPVVNLFERISEPIRLSHKISEYLLDPDQRNPRTTEIYAVNRVASIAPSGKEGRVFEPFYSIRHSYTEAKSEAFWYAARRPPFRPEDSGSDVFLSFVDLSFNPAAPANEVVHAEITCTNRDHPSRIKYSQAWGEFRTDATAVVRLRALVRPTETRRPPAGGARTWRLISHLALNHLSITNGVEALREILSLYDFSGAATGPLSVRSTIASLVGLEASRVVERVESEIGVVFGQGLRLDLEIDEDLFAGSGCFPFLCVLERFLGLYSAINSFTQLVARSKQRQGGLGVIRQWQPRAGEQTLV